jgi:CubicO group peptidase (beta-lactamase class C family)
MPIPVHNLAISRNGQVIYSSAHGMADLEHNTPITKTTKIEAGSVSKQFTAACILLLEQQGKLSLSDDIRKYVPEVPDYGNTITIRHLMNHVSGSKIGEALQSLVDGRVEQGLMQTVMHCILSRCKKR